MKKLFLFVYAVFSFTGLSFAVDLSGKVINIHTNQAQPNVKITAVPASSATDELEAITGTDGVFVISGLKNNSEYIIKGEISDKFLISPKNTKISTKKSDIKNLDLAYYPKYSVTGDISLGKFKSNDLNVMFKSGSPFYESSTSSVDENGRYKAEGLVYGQEYNVFIGSRFQVFGILDDNSITISGNAVKNMAVVPVFYGTGRVYDSQTHKGLKDIVVKAVSSNSSHEHTASTSSDGTFILNDLYYGESYIVTAEPQAGYELPEEIKIDSVKGTITDLAFPFISK